MYAKNLIVSSALAALALTSSARAADPLPLWSDGAAKQAIVAFVQATTTQGSSQFVPVAERIATFDQDGRQFNYHNQNDN